MPSSPPSNSTPERSQRRGRRQTRLSVRRAAADLLGPLPEREILFRRPTGIPFTVKAHGADNES